MELTPETVNQLIRNRRSIFPHQFEAGRIIPRETLEAVLENARWAPNHGRTEPWRFFVLAEAAKLDFADFMAQLYRRETPAADFDPKKFDKQRTKAEQSSHILGIGMIRGDKPKIPEVEEIEAVACAVQNLWLSLSVYGLAGYWSTGALCYHEATRQYFGLRPEDRMLGFFYLGYPAQQPGRNVRQPLAEKMEWWDQPPAQTPNIPS